MMKSIAALAFLCLLPSAHAEVRAFQLVSIEAGGVKVWLPSVLVVKKGDQVRIKAISKVPAPNQVHGLAIPEFKIAETVDEKGKDVAFVADHAGVFPMYCHLHPGHVGGQLVVLP
jgi:plastocyanin